MKIYIILFFLGLVCYTVHADSIDYTKAFGMTRGQLAISTGPAGLTYRTRLDTVIQFTNDLEDINAVLRHEMSSKETCQQFLEDDMARFLTVSMSMPRSYIITKDLFPLSSSFSKSEEALVIKYASLPAPQITDNSWSLNYNVLTNDGAVENWIITGNLCPLTIASFLRSPSEPIGAFSDISIQQLEHNYKEPMPRRTPLITGLPDYEQHKEIYAEKLKSIRIDIDYKQGPIQDFLRVLEQKCKDRDPEKTGVPFTLILPESSASNESRIHSIVNDISLKSATVLDVCAIATVQTGLQFQIDDLGIHFYVH